MENKTLTLILGIIAICGPIDAHSEEAVCRKCEKVREYNAAHPENNYYWYDDYLKEKKEENQGAKPQKESIPNSKV
ncbi:MULTISPECIES: hypothetical protein [unclassified Neochlamydia]|uniref:hypothetical protein n=1 Tax=unclassified Neochlamydia TaxID=2643326 RepID=UPI00140B4982|nr:MULTISPECIES: hypothetical protein [unclassified Neochlamydia]